MSRPQIRPHFDLWVRGPVDEVTRALEHRFADGGDMWAGHIVGHHAQLVIRRKQRNIWSPWLTFAIEPGEEGGTFLRGRFAPHPSGWTLYLACYGMLIITMLGLGFFGLSQWIAEEPPYMLWSVPVGLALLGVLYLSAFAGQRFSAGEMDGMRTFVLGGLERWETEWVEPRPAPEELEEQVDFSPAAPVLSGPLARSPERE